MTARSKWIDDYIPTETRDLKGIRWVLVLTMLLNFAATGVKLAAGLATGSLSVVADGLDSLFDGLSNIVGLAGLYAAGRPPDASHPYGHRKFETLAALSIAVLLFITAWQLLVTAWGHFRNPGSLEVNAWTVLAMVVSMAIQAGTSLYELRAGRRLRSEILVADAMHTRASILVSLSVLGGLGLVSLGFRQADALLAAFVAVMIARIGVDVLRETLPVLVDQAAIDPGHIAGVVDGIGGVESFHRVRSRGPTGSAAVDLHIRVAADKTLQEANAVADEVRRRLLEEDGINDVTVHVEPQHALAPEAPELFATLRHTAAELGLTIHEAWAYRLEDDLYAEMHVGVDPRLTLGEAHALVDRLEQEARARLPELHGVHTHIEMATTQVQEEGRPSTEREAGVREAIAGAVARFPELSNPHDIEIRYKPDEGDKLFVFLECTIAPETPVITAHHLASQLEEELGRRIEDLGDVSVHLEPPE